ncbi:MAG: FecR domain-containing protein [Myxococcota bacterium]
MSELERLGSEVREQLGAPGPAWLRAQRDGLRRAFSGAPSAGAVRNRWRLAWVPLLAVVVASIVWLWFPRAPRVAPIATDVVLNAPNSDRRVELADGSSLVLAPRSLARVGSAAEATRCVVEVGTIHFDVAPQRGRQFLVLAGAFEIRVIGTRFSVSREVSGLVEVRVEHGVVHVRAPSRSGPIELEAGDHLRGDEGGLSLTHPASEVSAPGSPAAVEAPSQPVESSASAAPAPSSNAHKGGGVPPHNDWQTLYSERKYVAALAAAKQLGVERLLESLGAQPLAELADTARLAGDSELALRAFTRIERRFPGSSQARDAVFLSGRVLAARGQADAARARFEKYLGSNARGAYSLEATGRLVELYAARGDARAKEMAKGYLERAPSGPYQRLCRSVLATP